MICSVWPGIFARLDLLSWCELCECGAQVCQDTLVGNDMVRGISGGQKKRVTTGARTCKWDHDSSGLSATVPIRDFPLYRLQPALEQLTRLHHQMGLKSRHRRKVW